jgi:AraC family transcriptional regulator
MRVERAKGLLAETDRSITEIAMDLGFSTSAYFTAVFHRETGTTPSDFRRQLEEGREPSRGNDNGRGGGEAA